MAGIPQVITEDRASGAQFIDGSLKFDSGRSQYLKRKPTVDGNRKLWTWSGWLKRTPGALHDIFSAGQEVTNDGLYSRFRIDSDDYLNYRQWVTTSSLDAYLVSSMRLRDPSAYFHYVAIYDSNNSTNSDKVRFYINGQRVTSFSSNDYPGGTNSSWVNSSSKTHTIGGHYDGGSSADSFFNGHMSQVYFLDGIAAGPEEFGYTDPLTNTWRPKKYTGTFTKSSPNNGTNWTQSLSASVGSLSNGANAFDGNLSTRAQTANAAAGKELTFAPPAINFTTSLEVYCDQGSNVPTATWNGNTVNPGGGAWVTVYSGSGELSSTYPLVINTESAAQYATLKGVRIDGEILIDNLNDSGANSFYLPMDGNTPIGKDQSGNGNDWTPIGFGGSVELPKATGAIPILNTNEGGTVARIGVRTDKKTYTVTASGGKYYLDGVETPTLNFLRGGTYIFDYTAASGHPFKFSTTSDGTHNSGSEYTDGTNTSTTNVMKITVPHNAPDTLYYYCSAHSGMGSSINVTTDIRKADPYAWKCVLALPMLSKNDVSASINVNSTTKATSINGDAETRSERWDLYGGAFYFDSTADYVQVTPTAGTTLADNTAPYTIEFFFSMNNGRFSDNTYNLMWSTSSGLSIAKWRSGISNKVYFESEGNQTGWGIQTQQNISANTWYHFAAVRDGNTIKTYLDGVLQGTATSTYSASAETWWRVGGQNADGSCHAGYIQDFRIYNGVAKYTEDFSRVSTTPDVLPDTPSGVSGKSKLTKITEGAVSFDGTGDYLDPVTSSDFGLASDDNFTIECFVYTSVGNQELIRQGTNNAGSDGMYFSITSSGALETRISGTTKTTTGAIDFNGWNHISVCRSGGTLYMSINGVVENHGSVTNSSTTGAFKIGSNFEETSFFTGYVSNVRFVKGTALYTSEFTPPTEPLTEVTNTKLLCCQSPTSATAAAVSPGSITANGDAAATNFNPFTDDINAIRGQETGYATFNPLLKGANTTLSNGNLTVSSSGGTLDGFATGTIFIPKTGKWFVEFTAGTIPTSTYYGMYNTRTWNPNSFTGTGFYGLQVNSGNKFKSTGSGAYMPAASFGDVIGVMYDADNNTLGFMRNGINHGVAFDNSDGIDYTDDHRVWWNTNGATTFSHTINFGQKSFKFPPPDGFQPLNLSSVQPEKVIARPDQYVKATTYTGDGSSSQLIETGMKPDLVWVKCRNQAKWHALCDSVRGNGKTLHPNSPDYGDLNENHIPSFTSNGFTVADIDSGTANESGFTYAAWTWKAGGSNGQFNIDDVGYASAAAAGLTAGTIAATGSSVGTKQGFSIVSYTAAGGSTASIPHGLEQSPDFVIIKNRDGGTSGSAGGWWSIYHDGFTNNHMYGFNNVSSSDSAWNNHGQITGTTSNLVQVANGDHSSANNWWTHSNGADYIMYSWHNVPGLQKFGTYTGNGSADGPFIELGFKPAIFWMKAANATGNWIIIDNKRPGYNSEQNTLCPNLTNAENASGGTTNDILSNGFKVRGTTDRNSSGVTYIYCAWAEAPSINLYGAQANAR